MNSVQIFNNANFGEIRTIVDGEKVLFCASDVAKALGYERPNDAIKAHCRYTVKRRIPHPQSPEKKIEMYFIPEGDVYRLIVRSKLPSAERFEGWVMDEVLPEIRKTGSYHSPKTYLEALKALVASEEAKEKLVLENKAMRPKAEYFDDLVERKTLTNFRDTAKELHLKPKEFISILLNNGFIYRDAKGQIKPYANYGEYFHIKEAKGSLNKWSGVQTLITPKGREAFRRLFNPF